MAQVSLVDVYKEYKRGIPTVKGINLGVENGEFMVLVGPSGCGKSTTLRLIAGLETLTRGQIFIGDRVVNDIPPKNRNIAMVFQNYALYPHMSVFDNMAFGLKLRKHPKAEIKSRVEEAAKILGISHLLTRKPRELSGGERQRVAVGRAIVRQPAVFLFDEPLSNLDAKLRVIMRTEIKLLHKKLRTTMIYVTHDQVEAMTMGDRICILKSGEIQQVDRPIEIYERPANKFVAGFIGTPPMNFFDGQIKMEKGSLYFVAQDIKLMVPDSSKKSLEKYVNRDIIMGIRSEDIHDSGYPGVAKQQANRVKARCKVIEPMGSDCFAYLSVGGQSFVARMRPHLAPDPDTSLEVLFDLNKMLFFDKTTEARVS